MTRCHYCRELLSEGEECDCPGVEKEAECIILRKQLERLAISIQEHKPQQPLDLAQLILEDREARTARVLAFRSAKSAKLLLSFKKPGPLRDPIELHGEGPTASEQVLKDRDSPEEK